jgi:hypothetical protein
MPDHGRQHPGAGHAQDRRGLPRGVGDEMVHRLMPRSDVAGIDSGGHGLDALALPRQAQAGDVGAQRLMTVSVAQGRGQVGHVGGKRSARTVSAVGIRRDSQRTP